jgi:prophage tail gpP-like protein
MLRFLFSDHGGEALELKNPLSMTLSMDEDIPADSVSVCFCGGMNIDGYGFLEISDGEEIIFSGIVDEVSRVISYDKDYTRVNARSMAAVLLDNESKPVFYNNLSTDVVFLNHLKPYGIKEYKGRNEYLPGSFNVSKGSTNWQVLQSFCVNRFGCRPRIRPDGTADFEGLKNDREVVFSNKNGIKYISVKENKRLFKRLSSVFVKCDDGEYSSCIANPEAGDSETKRERYLDATNPFVTTEQAEKMIRNSNRDCYVVTITCPVRLTGILGAKASADDLDFSFDNMYVSSLRYSLSYSGESTVVTLRRKI